MKEENILYYTILITTYNELIKARHLELAERIQSILGANELPKPSKHNSIDNKETSRFLVELTEEEIEIIQDLFLNLEVTNVLADGQTTPLASLYADYADIWKSVSPHPKTRTKNGI